MSNQPNRAGRHFLQIPGPTPVPERIISAMSRQILDHRGPDFQQLGTRVLAGIKTVFKTKQPVFIYPASGTGAWEAALTNTLSPGDKVLMCETGQFAVLWAAMANKLGLTPEVIATDWRIAADADLIEARLKQDKAHEIKAVCVVHNETSTGCRTRIDDVRKAIDSARHPALLMVDTISSLACTDLRHDEWGIDVTISGSQKGMMLPPGLSFTAVSDKALAATKTSKLMRSYFSWDDMLSSNATGFFPYTPATGLLYGLAEAIDMINEEGLENVFQRHERLAEATRRAVKAWGLDIQCRDAKYYSPAVTAVIMPEGHNADAFRKLVLETFNMSLGTGLNKIAGKVFRIGHLGYTNELTVMGALSGVEMGFELAGVPYKKGGAAAAMAYLVETASGARQKSPLEFSQRDSAEGVSMAGENGCYVFDAFGTLFDVHSAAHRHAARLGPDWARLSDIWRTKQLEYTWVNAGIGRHASFRSLTRDALLFALNAVQLDPALADDLMADYARLAVYPDAAEALATLKARDARLAILSNGDPDMLNALVTANGLDGVFDAVLSVSSANTFKPVPRVYALATEALGGSAGDITFLSSNRWDIAGATAFGFQTVWVNRAAQPDEYRDLAPSRTISSLAGLISAA